ncbi:MAG TPA: hypothetical protein PK264_02810 [Hyphomicrobiaceae bacterium]|nr:hypothetical protein [Hyphomicrobiaceae bacterium]
MSTTPRALTIGITGHRPNRLAIGEARTERRLTLVLAGLRKGALARPVALSALAEGADRLFAAAALALGYRLKVLLPFKSADYETTFSDTTTTPDYRALLARAAHVEELPGTLANTKAAYEAVGRATVAASDILVAVWDGRPAAARGGTPEIIEYALAAGTPVVWIDAARDQLPRKLASPTAGGRRHVPLANLARRAKPITMRALGRLAEKVLEGRH